MRIQDALIGWNSASPFGQNKLDRYPSGVIVAKKVTPFPRGWWKGYSHTGGACGSDWRKMTDEEAALAILVLFRRLVLQEGIPPQTVHEAFYQIEGYRNAGGWHMSLEGDEFNP